MARSGGARTWLVRTGVATALLSAVGLFAEPGRTVATSLIPGDPVSATRAVLVFLAALLLAVLLGGRTKGDWRPAGASRQRSSGGAAPRDEAGAR